MNATINEQESIVLEMILNAMRKRDERVTVTLVERKSPQEFDVRFAATVDAPSPSRKGERMQFNMGGWLPLAFIRECTIWTSAEVASMTDYPEMAMEGDWSGVRDTEASKIWAIFQKEVGL